MKANKGLDSSVEVSPSQKKLKQARLPFKLISDVPPSPDSVQTRKRKLSAQESEVVSKIGKISQKNGVKDDPIVLSDDDSKDGQKSEKEVKLPNPFVKLVDTAMKKKLRKSKTPKKRKISKNNNIETTTDTEPVQTISVDCKDTKVGDEEPMEVDDKVEDIENKDNIINNISMTETVTPVKIQSKSDSIDSKSENVHNKDDVIDLDDESMEESENISPVSEQKSSDTNKEPSKEIKNDNTSKTESPNKTPVTPKRSPRNRAPKTIDNDKSSLNMSTSSSKLDESISSAPSTPKQNKKSAVNSADESLNVSNSSLTPKQLAKKLESAKKREEREKEKQEKEKKRLQEKEERDKLKKEKEDQKKKEKEEKEEAKKKEREEKEEQKRKEREEKEKQRELEKQMKEHKEELKRKEKEAKEEQRQKEKEAREEERRKKQEALELEKQEQELKKKKAAEAFVNFFVPKQKTEKDQAVLAPSKNNMLSSFSIKSDMRLAPTVRTELTDERKKTLEGLIKSQEVSESKLYVKSLKSGEIKPETCGKTWPLDDKDDVVIVEDELQPPDDVGEVINCESVRETLRPKLFSFHENRRPPYWGTWRKRSAAVTPRRPFGQDDKQLDYSVDSDDEWEEEQEGESISGSACGSETEDNDDYEVDNEVFVPHGYLSDEEATMDDGDVLSLSPEAQQAKLKYLEDEFETEMKKPTEKLKPRLYGPIWENSDGGKPDKCVDALWNYFGKFTMIMGDPVPLLQPAPEPEETEKKKKKSKKSTPPEGESSPKSEKKKKAKEPKEAKKAKVEAKKTTTEVKKSQLGINSFLTKLKST